MQSALDNKRSKDHPHFNIKHIQSTWKNQTRLYVNGTKTLRSGDGIKLESGQYKYLNESSFLESHRMEIYV